MKTRTLIKTLTIAGILTVISISQADARDYPISAAAASVENSSTHMSGVGKLVLNPKNRPCNSVVDCRKKGQSLYKISQLNSTDFASKSVYPQSAQDARRQRQLNYWANK